MIMFWTRDWMSGRPLLQGNNSGESMNGTSGGEFIYGNGGADWINAGGGSDIVFGGTGADIMKGGGGSDYLNGGTENDLLIGGTEKDILTGGSGKDTFQFSLGDSWANTSSADRITDFDIGDKLDVTDYVEHSRTAVGFNVGSMELAQYWANGLASTYGYGSALFTNGVDIYVLMDMNGDRYMETGVVLENANALGANLNALANHNDFYLFD